MRHNLYLEAPNNLENYSAISLSRTIFLAGSITGASDWQKEVSLKLLGHFNLFNPRRQNYSTLDPKVEREQIAWEFRHLELAEITLFYFAPETLAPITLLEYGKQLVKCHYAPYRRTYVCIHPEYKRKNDVIIQTELVQPALLKDFYGDLDSMCKGIIKDYENKC